MALSTMAVPVVNILVIGECGEGKSTLIKFFAKSNGVPMGALPVTGTDLNGVTKVLMRYDCGIINGVHVYMIDTPGVGDERVKTGVLVGMIEEFFRGEPLQGVIFCNRADALRIKLGTSVVSTVVQQGFSGQQQWEKTIFCGTHADRASRSELESFRTKAAAVFNKRFNAEIDKVAVICINEEAPELTDVSELEQKIGELPGTTMQYVEPDAADLATALSADLGVDPIVVEKEIRVTRGFFEEMSHGFKKGFKKIGKEISKVVKEIEEKLGDIDVEEGVRTAIEKLTGR